eukprot:GHVS01030169.1.p2 GENE.GHVS01030169.1~~GHVS01030169.1.p2  ORF type:complete len:106 (+),score=14.04 GHVS01030169.1:154-471(+)
MEKQWRQQCVRKGETVDIYEWKETQQNEISGVFEVRLSRANKRNAMGEKFWSEFPAAVRWTAALPQLRVILVGADGPVFSAGIDCEAPHPHLLFPSYFFVLLTFP